MKSLLILEHPKDILLLKERYEPGDLFIGFTPASAYELERNGFRYKIPSEYYEHSHFFSLYQGFTSSLIDILVTLDKILWDIDMRFREVNLKPFLLELYDLKIAIDTIYWYIYILGRIVKQESPQKVIIVASGDSFIEQNESLYFCSKDPICYLILLELSRLYSFKIDIIRKGDNFLVNKSDNFNKIRKEGLSNGLFWFKKLIMSKVMLLRNFGYLEAKIFSVNCKDLASIRLKLIHKGYIVEMYLEKDFEHIETNVPYRHYEIITGAIRESKELREACYFEQVNFYGLLEKVIFKFCRRLDIYFRTYAQVYDFMKNRKYDFAILSFLSSNTPINRMVADICKKMQVPCICWMHGGYGAYKSFEGYDISDLLFCNYHLTYGSAINAAIDTFYPVSAIGTKNLEKISMYYPIEENRTFTAGAPFMERLYAQYSRPNNKKEVIIFIMGELWLHNIYYMGGNCPYSYFQKWNEVKAILKTLMCFQKRYNVILKTYPFDQEVPELLNKFLKDNDALDIKIIRDELPIEELIKGCDLTISTWVSTTFFHAAFADCDQFLFDDADLTEEARQIVDKAFFFSDDIEGFCCILGNYLEKGEFYQKPKEDFRIKFLDSQNAKHRVSRIKDILQKIKEDNNV